MSNQQATETITRREFTRDLIFPKEQKQLLVVTIRGESAFWELWTRIGKDERGRLLTCGVTKTERIDAIAKDCGWTERKK